MEPLLPVGPVSPCKKKKNHISNKIPFIFVGKMLRRVFSNQNFSSGPSSLSGVMIIALETALNSVHTKYYEAFLCDNCYTLV